MFDLASQRLEFGHQTVEACFQTRIAGMLASPLPVPAARVVSGSMPMRLVPGKVVMTGVMPRRVGMGMVRFRMVSMTVVSVVAQMVMTVVVLSGDPVC